MSTDAGPGLLIAFEGGEGAGKSSQIRLLAEHLRARGRDVVVTFEPGATEVGKQIRRLVLDTPGHIEPRAEALLFAADRAHHVATVIRPALALGRIVLTDRFVDSSVAYQGAGRVLSSAEIAELSAWATGGLTPDLTVLLDVEPAVGLGRAKSRTGSADRLEQEELAFHERVRAAFLERAAAAPQRYLVLDGAAGSDLTAAEIRERVEALTSGPAEVLR